MFYKLMKLLGVDIVDNHADYRLISKRALEALAEFKEVNLFLRGIVKQIGFKSMPNPLERPFPDLGTLVPTLPQCV